MIIILGLRTDSADTSIIPFQEDSCFMRSKWNSELPIAPVRVSLISNSPIYVQLGPIGSGDDGITRLNATTGIIESTSPPKYHNVPFELDPTGKYLAIPFHEGSAEILDAQTWEIVDTLYVAHDAYNAAWDPTAPRVLFLMKDRRIYEWDLVARQSSIDGLGRM